MDNVQFYHIKSPQKYSSDVINQLKYPNDQYNVHFANSNFLDLLSTLSLLMDLNIANLLGLDKDSSDAQ